MNKTTVAARHGSYIVKQMYFINSRSFASSNVTYDKLKCKLLVVGGGTGGSAVAAKMNSALGKGNVMILDAADKHYYQPMFTMIGGGMKKLSDSFYPMADVIPKGVRLVKDEAVTIDAAKNTVTTKTGDTITYDILLVAVGLQLKYDRIPGLEKALAVTGGNVTSIYSPKYVDRHFEALQKFEKGNAVFTFPASPIKCPGAPQKICYITEDYLRKAGKRNAANISYHTALPVIFGAKHFADALWKVVKKRGITVNLKSNLIEVIPDKNQAIFQNIDEPNDKTTVEYSLLHVTPYQGPPDVLVSGSPGLTNDAGYVDVNKNTLQHIRYPNVFSIGDCSSTPNSKTMASAAGQAGVVYANMKSFLAGQPLIATYDGYASCPLVTGYSSAILAEFDYDLQPLETFPFAQDRERYSMFLLKKYALPMLYWQLMVKGWWSGPAVFRKMFAIFKTK